MKKKQYLLENKEYEKKILATLLYLVKTREDIFSLLKLGCDVAQVPLLLQQAKEAGYIHRLDGKLCLTELGGEKLEELKNYILKEKKSLVAPRYEAKIHTIPLDSIYLPAQMGQYWK